jgi:hypothetical protein
MLYLTKIIAVGRDRQVLYQYVKRTKEGGMVARFDDVSPTTPACAVIKDEDHHAKLHLHLLCDQNPNAPELMEALCVMHPNLRFTVYYTTGQGYGTMHGRNGQVESHVYKETDTEVDQPAAG